ncbi:MAG: hypothetical protein FWC27_05715, partial [Firmicutes bacterium]|nr:hypothetical protein [Bacillota bacterium]
ASGADRDTEWIDPPEGGGGGGVTVISSFAEIESAGTPLAIADNQYTVIDWIPAAGLNGIQDPPVTIRALETISPQQLPQPPQNTATIYNAAGDRWMLNNEPALGGVVFTVTPAGQVAAGFYYIYDGGLFSQVTGIQINTGWNKMVSGNPIQFDPCTAEDVGTIDAANIQGTYNLLEFTCQAQIKTEYKAGLYAKIAGKWALVGPGA